jgi:hypothetical protein
MERIKAVELLDASTAAAMPWMAEESRSKLVADLTRQAEGRNMIQQQDKWGGGYGSNVDAEKLEDFTGRM